MTFQWPWLLFLPLIVIPILVVLYVVAQMQRRKYALRFTNVALLSQVAGKGPGIRRHIPAVLFLSGLTFLLISLARPEATIRIPKDEASVVVAIDVSGSMQAEDLKPNRMEAAKSAAQALVDTVPDQLQLALISFNAGANLNVPLSRDKDSIRRSIDRLSANGGTAIGEAIFLGLDQLANRQIDAQAEKNQAIIVLLSDGTNTAGRPPEMSLERAKTEGVKIYTIGVGERGASPALRSGQRVGLDETTLQRIAEATDGEYFYAANAGDLERVYADLGSQISWVEEKTEVTALFSALGAMFFTLAGLLSLWWFSRLP